MPYADEDDYDVEPVRGLPELPPPGEKILWQGAPTVWRAAVDIYRLNWILGWFAFLAGWRGIAAETSDAAGSAIFWSLLAGGIATAILFVMAWATAKTTVYTITNRRVGMRIGVALTLTLNLPHQWIDSADLRLRKQGAGDIALKMKGDTKLSYLVLWPHARPWKMNPAIPMLRGLENVQEVAGILGEAAKARIAEVGDAPVHTAPQPETTSQPQGDLAPMPAE